MILTMQMNSFSLLGLPQKFQLDAEAIEQGWKKAIAMVHPDRFADRPVAERRVAEQWAGRINEAREALDHPINRAIELLKLNGVDIKSETDTRMPVEFLMQQMSWREAAEEGDEASRARLVEEVTRVREEEIEKLTKALDEKQDWPQAKQSVRRLMFIEKMLDELAGKKETL